MLDKNEIIKVKNRDNGAVGYRVPDLGNLHRSFQPHEEKEVTMEELRKLSYLPGGDVILRDYLIIENQEAVNELLGEVEPEYNYTEEDIKYLLEKGTLDQLMDTLDFAPSGVIDLVKDIAVKVELNDINKRDAIFEKTGFNVTSAIDFNKETAESENTNTQSRRAAPINKEKNENNNGGRRSPIIIKNK